MSGHVAPKSLYFGIFAALMVFTGITVGVAFINLGPFNFQPAEMAKFTVLIALCAYLSEERSDEVSYARFLGGLILVGAPALLIIAQPDLGSASVIITIAMGVLLVAGAKPKYIALITFLSLATLTAAFAGGLVNRYQTERLRVFLDQETTDPALKDAAYQVRNAIRYVLLNERKHCAERGEKVGKYWVDPYSSGYWFDGWAKRPRLDEPWQKEIAARSSPAAAPTTWLLTTGWRRHGLIALDEIAG